jgi:amino acid adenylation domain-containing protein
MRLDRLVTPVATRQPDHVAIKDPSETLTYAQLDSLANRFANSFRSSGARPGDLVGIHLARSGRGVAAMLGALRAGLAYVPLDPGSPPSRVKLIVDDCALRHVVISPELMARWVAANTKTGIEHYFLSGDGSIDGPPATQLHPWTEILAAPAGPLEAPGTSADDLAYVLYTSGSTGVPKGVMLSHRNALAFVDWAADEIELGPDDIVSSVAPFHFDLSVFDVWASLSRGASIVVVDEATVVSGPRMLDCIHANGIRVWYSVPSALVLMLETGRLAERGAPSLRTVFFAGEVFPLKHLRATMTAIPQARFYNLFGPTETNVCLAHRLPGVPADDASAIPVGRPSCGDVANVLDPEGRPVPDGEMGELFIEGPTVMLGYWDGGRRTPPRIPYPTGDLVSRRPDGEFMYHGRRDHMIKIHGFRVEPAEIEAALNAHSQIREAIVMAVEQRLVAVVVPSDADLSVLDVKRHCASRLPKYMIPGDVRLVAALPRTSNGKTDRVRTRTAVLEGDSSVLGPVSRDR